MLRFAENPDTIFTQILDSALVHAIDTMIRSHLDEKYDPNQWQAQFPHASKVFSPDTALPTVKELQKGNLDVANLWELNDYHYCLLYDILDDFCAVRNDMGKEIDLPFAVVDNIKIWKVDFDMLSELFFPDTDFLIPQQRMEDMDEDTKEQFGYRPETFPIAMGLKPHADELKLKLWEEGNFVPQKPMDSVFSKNSSTYPELSYE